jgi:hypothetical protein
MLRVERYKKTRYWAIWDGQELVALTVYRRGALEVRRRLQARAAEAALERVQAEEGEGCPLTGDTDLW